MQTSKEGQIQLKFYLSTEVGDQFAFYLELSKQQNAIELISYAFYSDRIQNYFRWLGMLVKLNKDNLNISL